MPVGPMIKIGKLFPDDECFRNSTEFPEPTVAERMQDLLDQVELD